MFKSKNDKEINSLGVNSFGNHPQHILTDLCLCTGFGVCSVHSISIIFYFFLFFHFLLQHYTFADKNNLMLHKVVQTCCLIPFYLILLVAQHLTWHFYSQKHWQTKRARVWGETVCLTAKKCFYCLTKY